MAGWTGGMSVVLKGEMSPFVGRLAGGLSSSSAGGAVSSR